MKLTRRRLVKLIREALEPSVQEKIADMTPDQVDKAINELENYNSRSMSRRGFLAAAAGLGIISSIFGQGFVRDDKNRKELLAQLKATKGINTSLESWLQKNGYQFEDYEVASFSKSQLNAWDPGEGDWYYWWKNIGLWLSYHMPQFRVLDVDDMMSRNMRFVCIEAGDLYRQLDSDFVEISHPGIVKKEIFGSVRKIGVIPEDGAIIGEFQYYDQLDDGSYKVGTDMAYGKIKGRKALKFMSDEAVDFILFLE